METSASAFACAVAPIAVDADAVSEPVVITEPFAGYEKLLASGLELIHELLSRYWDNVYPLLEDGDPTMRMNTLAPLMLLERTTVACVPATFTQLGCCRKLCVAPLPESR